MTDPISMYGRLERLDPGSRNGRTDGATDAADFGPAAFQCDSAVGYPPPRP